MTDFIRTYVTTNLDQQEIFSLVSRALPEFSWRMGDSDAQGLYVSGIGDGTGHIQLWLSDNIADVTISLRGVKDGGLHLDRWKDKLFNNVIREVLPTIGEVGQVIEMD